jgi:hypothetical protein
MRKLFVMGLVALFAVMIASPLAFGQRHDNGSISGTVTDQNTGLPIVHAMVQALGQNHYPATAMTGNNGQYQIYVPNGSYKIAAGKMGYGLEWWQEVADSSLATVVVVAESINVENINFTLTPPPPPPSGTISGVVVTDDTLPRPIPGAMVRAEGNGIQMMTHCDSLGNYSITIPYGNYFVHAEARDFHGEWWQEVAERRLATAVNVAEGQNPVGINFTLTPYGPPPPPPPPPTHGSIAGLITNAATSSPLADADVMIQSRGMHPMHHEVETGDDGTYLADNLPSGYYFVTAHKEGFVPNQFADSIYIDSTDVTGIDIALTPIIMGSIVGLITDGITNLPIAHARVMAADVNDPRHHFMAVTDSTGAYTLEIPTGSYHVDARAEGYYPAVIDSPVVVGDFAPVTVNIVLAPIVYGSISGHVYDTLETPIRHAWVEARVVNGNWRAHVRTDSTGYYTFAHAIPGNYILSAHASHYQMAVYPDTVIVADNQAVTGIDFHLAGYVAPNGTISGIVTADSTGLPISGAMVVAFGVNNHHFHSRFARTDSTGAYSLGKLQNMPYKLMCIAHGYVGEFYNNKTNWNEADTVTPNAEAINFGLALHSTGPRFLAGQIIENNEPVAGAVVVALIDDQIVDITSSLPDGNYEFADIEPGNYTIQVLGPNELQTSETFNVMFNDINEANIVLVTTGIDDNVNLPISTTLEQNYPNPFNASTNIKFNLVKQSEINLTVYDLLGRKVATLASGILPAGQKTINWNGIDANGQQVASGMYLYVLKVDGSTESKHMMLLK